MMGSTIIALLVLLWPVTTAAQGELWRSFMDAGATARASGDSREAEEQYRAAVREAQSRSREEPVLLAQSALWLAEVLAGKSRHEEAIEWYAIGIHAYEDAARLEQAHAEPLPRFDPQQGAAPYRAELAVALQGLGRSLLAKGQLALAEKAFRRGLAELDARPIVVFDISSLTHPWQKSYRPAMSRTESRSSISFDLARLYEDQGRPGGRSLVECFARGRS